MRIKRFSESSKSEYVETLEDAFIQMMDEFSDCDFSIKDFPNTNLTTLTIARKINKVSDNISIETSTQFDRYITYMKEELRFTEEVKAACGIAIEIGIFESFKFNKGNNNTYTLFFYHIGVNINDKAPIIIDENVITIDIKKMRNYIENKYSVSMVEEPVVNDTDKLIFSFNASDVDEDTARKISEDEFGYMKMLDLLSDDDGAVIDIVEFIDVVLEDNNRLVTYEFQKETVVKTI